MAVALKKELTKTSSIYIQPIKHNDWLYIKDMIPEIHQESRYRTSKLSMLKVFDLFNTTMNDKDHFCFLAWRDDKVIGLISGYCAEHYFTEDIYAYESMFYVRPEYRKGRTALLLLRTFEKWAKDNNCVEISVGISTEIDTEKTASFYEKLKYKRSAIGLRKEI
jgi:GNAT superfamily N-acetyltransferase